MKFRTNVGNFRFRTQQTRVFTLIRVMSVQYGALTNELTTPKVQYGALAEDLKEAAKPQDFITMKTYRLSAHERQSGIYRGMCIPSVVPPRDDI